MDEPRLSAAQMLDLHREVWDMPTLTEQYPSIVEHIADRYEGHFDMFIVVPKDTGIPEGFTTTDVRVLVETLLAREAATAAPASVRHLDLRH